MQKRCPMDFRYTLKEIAAKTKATLIGNPSHEITGINNLEEASFEDASFLSNPRYSEAMKKSKAGLICVDTQTNLDPSKNYLVHPDPSHIFQQIASLFHPTSKNMSGFSGIHPQAIIHPSAKIEPGVQIGPFAVIDADVTIGKNTKIYPHVYIGNSSKIGENCTLYSHSCVRECCVLKNHVILQPGAVIGSCGFGYLPNEKGEFIKLEQLGIVILEDYVEIGANTTIDRARFKTTRIGRGTKIDNLVQVAHNVEIGKNTVIAAQTGIAGSTKIGNQVMMGGQVGILGHVVVSDNTLLATRSGVSKSLTKPGKYRGSPAIPILSFNKREVYLRNIEKLHQKIENLEKKLEALEQKALSS